MALPTAGATQTMGVSPAPAEGRSTRLRSTVSSTGTSLKRGSLEHGPHAGVLQVQETEGQGIHGHQMGELIHVGLASEVVGRRRVRKC